jgi:hypothetical protein
MFRRLTKEQRIQRARLGLVGLVALVAGLAWLSGRQPAVSERVVARVVAVDRGTHEHNPVALFTARVRLEDGSDARIVVHEPLPAVGDHVELIAQRHGDGSLRYRLAPARERRAPAR